MLKRGLLLCVMFLVSLMVAGCGIPQEDYDAVVAERDATQAEVASLQNVVDQLESKVESLESEADTLRNDLVKTESQIESLQSNLAVVEKQLEKMEAAFGKR